MTFFKNPQPEDRFLFWVYLLGMLFSIGAGFVFFYSDPITDGCGHMVSQRGAAIPVWVCAAICLTLAENRRSGWFFWIK